MEQKFVQRCETKVVADACNASYVSIPYSTDPGVRLSKGRGKKKL